MTAADVMKSKNPAQARYAIAFSIPSQQPFHAADLAFMLLRFQDFHIRDSDYCRFNIISLSYHLGPDGTYGLLLYDKNLRSAYRKAVHRARQSPSKYISSHSTWPPDLDAPSIRTTANITILMSNVERLARL
ncbi:hypothetical protein B0H19DRAFT_974315 [Mycena capillaripes]|nr:hypothetical protein B0H19DRAFT_974315 [Mycena capillaripes]